MIYKLSISALIILFYFSCHDIHQISTAVFRVLPNYIFTYGPMVVVMIMNPILYLNSSKEIDLLLTASLSQSTHKERQIMDTFKLKYSFINVIFYVCWLPNLINGVILWFFWFELPVKLIITTWYIMVGHIILKVFQDRKIFIIKNFISGNNKSFAGFFKYSGLSEMESIEK